MAEMVKMSDLAEELRPALVQLINALGYTDEQAAKFAQGYLDKVAKLPMMEKLRALGYQDGRCMTAGFEAAGIDEDEAFERYQELPDEDGDD